MATPFTVYLSSFGSQKEFSSNNVSQFSHTLESTLTNADEYDVRMSGCVLSPAPTTPVLIWSNLVPPQPFDGGKLSIIGMCDYAIGLHCSEYTPVSLENVSVIRCSLTDLDMKPLPAHIRAIVALHFKPKPLSVSRKR